MDSPEDRAAQAGALADEGEALHREGRLAEAEDRFRRAVALAPTATRVQNLATLRQILGDYPQAEALFRDALALDPNLARARASLGLVILAQGRFAEGFPLFDAWRRVADGSVKPAPETEIPQWSGEDVAGKNVVIWGEEGYGDQIMFARFAPLLQAAGAEVAWVCDPAMLRLVQEGLGMRAIATGGRVEIVGAHYIAPSSRLPVVFMPRMAAPPPLARLAPPKPNVIEGLKVGVVARGNPRHGADRHRSLPPEAAAELMALPGAVSLAPEETGARDFWDTAGIIAGLDLVISVDTSVAHLAGALGKPCWLLLSALACDWRWGPAGETSAWYPSMRLFRQTTPDDWTSVIAEVKTAFAARQN
jgi:hypothetical protein